MNDLRNFKTVYEAGKLPAIIADTEVFKTMTRKERTAFYANLAETINLLQNQNPDLKDLQRSQDLFKAMCLYPEKRLNQAFLENKFKNEDLWHFYVGLLENALFMQLTISLYEFQHKHETYTVEIKRAEKRIQQMQKAIKKYQPLATVKYQPQISQTHGKN